MFYGGQNPDQKRHCRGYLDCAALWVETVCRAVPDTVSRSIRHKNMRAPQLRFLTVTGEGKERLISVWCTVRRHARERYDMGDYGLSEDHSQAAVVNLGCRLNMTGRRADNGACRIYNLDFSDVIKCRNEIIPAGEREENIACDLNDFSWMYQIDTGDGAVFYAAGVFHNFSTRQVKAMVIAMAERFPGGRLVFDALNKF